MSNLEVGDVVCLKSGGPEMTITDTGYDEGKVQCSWFAKNEEVKRDIFLPNVLEKTR